MSARSDIIMITYRSAGYVDLSLPRLLDTCGERDRVWLWHNGDDEATLEALRPYLSDDRVHRFHHSRDNVKLREPTNWLWGASDAMYVSKVDDDCLVSAGWLDVFASVHQSNPWLGAVCSWRHPQEDFRPELALQKVQGLNGGHQLMRNLWVQGSGYLLPTAHVRRLGGLRSRESFTGFCLRLEQAGARNGYYFPFVREDHMDDPRSCHSLIHDDATLRDRMPLSAAANGVSTVADWTAQLRRSAVLLQSASLDVREHTGWRRRAGGVRRRARSMAGRVGQW